MTDIGELFLSGSTEHIVNSGRQIFQAKILLHEVPELSLARIKRSMILSKPSSSVICHPNIVTLVSQDESRGKISIIGYPEVHITQHTCHHKNDGLLGVVLASFSWNSVDLTNIAILSDHGEGFRCITILIASLNEVGVAVVACEGQIAESCES